MKHLYRNILCIVLILVAIGGIVLMALNMMDILSDNLNTISRSIADGTNGFNYDTALRNEEIMTITSDYNGCFYMRSDSWGEPKDDLCTDFKSGEKYTVKTSYNPLGYYTKKAILSNAPKYTYSVEVKHGSSYLYRPDYSETGLNDEKSTDIACKPFQKNYEGIFYPEVDETKISEAQFDENIQEEESQYQKYVHKKYTTLPGSASEQEALKQRLLNFAKEKGLNKDSKTIIEDVSDYFHKNYYYAQPDIPKKENRALYILEKSDHGICNNFASASYYLYRALGIPTRIVCGYLALNPTKNADGTYKYVVTVEQCHAWNEVYIDGSGWKRVDNTASRSDLNDKEFDNSNNQIGKLSSSTYESSSKKDSSSSSITPDNDDTLYGTGTIVIKDSYDMIYDGTQKKMLSTDFFYLESYQFNEDYSLDYNGTDLVDDNLSGISLETLLARFNKGDKLEYNFKYKDQERIDCGYYQFVCASFKIVDSEGNDVTKRYGIIFIDENRNSISYNKKKPIIQINKKSTNINYMSEFVVSESQLPYTVSLSPYMTDVTGYTVSMTLPKTILTREDFTLSEDLQNYEYIMTPTIQILDKNGKDCTDNFEFEVHDLKFKLEELEE